MTQRREPIRSRAYLNGAKGESCIVDGCERQRGKSRGMCIKHYSFWLRHRTPRQVRNVTGPWLRDHAEHSDDACLVWPFARRDNGYGMATLDGRLASAHRLMCELAHGRPPTPKHEAAHSCGKGHLGCVNPRHLSWKTRLENKNDELAHGTRNRGERGGGAKLRTTDVLAIRASGVDRAAALAAKYGVSKRAILDILHKKTWSWL